MSAGTSLQAPGDSRSGDTAEAFRETCVSAKSSKASTGPFGPCDRPYPVFFTVCCLAWPQHGWVFRCLIYFALVAVYFGPSTCHRKRQCLLSSQVPSSPRPSRPLSVLSFPFLLFAVLCHAILGHLHPASDEALTPQHAAAHWTSPFLFVLGQHPGAITSVSAVNEILSLGETKIIEFSIRNPYPYEGQLTVTVDVGEVSSPAKAQTASFEGYGGLDIAALTGDDLALLVRREKEERRKAEEERQKKAEDERKNQAVQDSAEDGSNSSYLVTPSSQSQRRQQDAASQRPFSTSGASLNSSPFRPFSSFSSGASLLRTRPPAYPSDSLSYSPWSYEDDFSDSLPLSAVSTSKRRARAKRAATTDEDGALEEPHSTKKEDEAESSSEDTETKAVVAAGSAVVRRTQRRTSANFELSDEDFERGIRTLSRGAAALKDGGNPPISVARNRFPPRLVIKLKEGNRSREFEKRTRAFQQQKWIDQGFVESAAYGDMSASAGVSVTVDDPSELEKNMRGFFSLNEQQAELVASLSHLKQLDLLVLRIEESLLFDSSDAEKLKDAFADVADIDFVEFDQVVYALDIVPNDQLFSLQWNLHYPRNRMADVGAPQAWEVVDAVLSEKRERGELGREDRDLRGRVVAVIDTGVNYLHPDLKNQMWVNTKELYGAPGVDDDGNGYVDDVYGYDFVNDQGDPMDRDGHGTHCAGIIAAQANNGLGIAGVNSRARVMALKFMEGDTGYVSDAARALDYAIQNGAAITSNSWGNAARLPRTMIEAVQRSSEKNVLFVTASGNASPADASPPSASQRTEEGRLGRDLDRAPLYPAALLNSNVLTVGAIGQGGELASFSHFGKKTVDLAAPGVNIFSTWLLDAYEYKDGTSQACPLVAGIASLLWTMKPEASYEEIKRILIASSRRLPTLQQTIAHGLVDAYAAAATIQETLGRWVAVDAPPTLSQRTGAKVSLELRGKQNGFYRSQVRILADYQGAPMNLATLPIRLQVAESPVLEFPPVIYLEPALRNANSLPVALPLKVPIDQGPVTLQVLKIDATVPGAFYYLTPPGDEIKIVNKLPLSTIKVGCRIAAVGSEDGILTLRARLDDASVSPSSSSPTPSSSPSSLPVERIYTVRLRCVAIDVRVGPAFLDLALPANTQKKQEIEIEKGERLFQREVRFSVEFVSILDGAASSPGGKRGAPPAPSNRGRGRESGYERLRGANDPGSGRNPLDAINPPRSIDSAAAGDRAGRGGAGEGPRDLEPYQLGPDGEFYDYLVTGMDALPGLTPVKFHWNDISKTGQTLLGPGRLNRLRRVPLGFDFPFWGEAVRFVFVSPTGFVATEAMPATEFLCTPSMFDEEPPNGVLAPLWMDFPPSDSPASNVFFQAWRDRAIFQWQNVHIRKRSFQRTGTPAAGSTFQLVLHSSGKILFYYKSVAPTYTPRDWTAAVIGVESPDGRSAMKVLDGIPEAEMAILVYPSSLVSSSRPSGSRGSSSGDSRHASSRSLLSFSSSSSASVSPSGAASTQQRNLQLQQEAGVMSYGSPKTHISFNVDTDGYWPGDTILGYFVITAMYLDAAMNKVSGTGVVVLSISVTAPPAAPPAPAAAEPPAGAGAPGENSALGNRARANSCSIADGLDEEVWRDLLREFTRLPQVRLIGAEELGTNNGVSLGQCAVMCFDDSACARFSYRWIKTQCVRYRGDEDAEAWTGASPFYQRGRGPAGGAGEGRGEPGDGAEAGKKKPKAVVQSVMDSWSDLFERRVEQSESGGRDPPPEAFTSPLPPPPAFYPYPSMPASPPPYGAQGPPPPPPPVPPYGFPPPSPPYPPPPDLRPPPPFMPPWPPTPPAPPTAPGTAGAASPSAASPPPPSPPAPASPSEATEKDSGRGSEGSAKEESEAKLEEDGEKTASPSAPSPDPPPPRLGPTPALRPPFPPPRYPPLSPTAYPPPPPAPVPPGPPYVHPPPGGPEGAYGAPYPPLRPYPPFPPPGYFLPGSGPPPPRYGPPPAPPGEQAAAQ
ncbi:subtilisin SUB12 [Besnoitia besnoiti]|uniref:subtilisin n=1 Tax=Besnoitia besnoiti TaxID=94643 RepID=A0A2A9MDP9_BESBE|nr:subtilisin SUB12 [Besnoitia besnoiti]PFH33803.1 subtilisin SUB12 [Besnoitia besnoiti]